MGWGYSDCEIPIYLHDETTLRSGILVKAKQLIRSAVALGSGIDWL
jgi:hypothetical protein